jgi:hypothetical protein
VCSRHCRALLRKQVLPLLNSPGPRLHDSGHVRSTPPGNSEGVLAFSGATWELGALAGENGGGLGVSGR